MAEIFARMGAEIPDTTLVDWCGRAMKVLKPLNDRIEAEVMANDLLHADDTPIRVLDRSLRDRGLGKGVKKGRIWAYVRDQRPWAGAAPPGAVYRFAPDWKEEHVREHLQKTEGILKADGYKGYAKLYDPGPGGSPQLREAACWAHLRRDFHDVWTSTGSAIAREALDRIGALYDIEREITGQTADVRRAVRQEQSRPRVEAFRAWAERQLTRIPGKGDLARAFRYGLSRWPSFCVFLEDGRVAIDNNPAERAKGGAGGVANGLLPGEEVRNPGAEHAARLLLKPRISPSATTTLALRGSAMIICSRCLGMLFRPALSQIRCACSRILYTVSSGKAISAIFPRSRISRTM